MILNKLFNKEKYNFICCIIKWAKKTFIISLIFSIVDRLLKTLTVSNTLNNIIISNQAITYNDWINLLFCILLFGVRYLCSAYRNIYAYRAAYNVQDNLYTHYYKLWMYDEYTENIKDRMNLLYNVGNRTINLISKFSIDFVPGILSVIISSRNCYKIIRYPYNYICVSIIIFTDIVIYLFFYNQIILEEKLSEEKEAKEARSLTLATNTLENNIVVNSFNKQEFEINEYIGLRKQLQLIKDQRLFIFNKKDSFKGWIEYFITGIVLWYAKGNLLNDMQIVLILMYVNDIKYGLYEIKNFIYHWNHFWISWKLLYNVCPSKMSFNSIIKIINNKSVTLKNINLRIFNKNIYKNLSLNINPKDKIVLFGENGAGKTSLFKLLSQEYKPQEGNLEIPNKEYIFVCEQKPSIFTNFSVAYNIAYGSCNNIKDISNKFSDYGESVIKAVKLLEIEYLENSNTEKLSGGECQRIGIARLIIRAIESPKKVHLLLLDECDSAQDNYGKKLIYKAISFIQELTQCTTIIIAHNITDFSIFNNYYGLILTKNSNIIKYNLVSDAFNDYLKLYKKKIL